MDTGEVSPSVASAGVPLLFLFGPSGSGKSTLAAYVREDLCFLHLEIDRFPDGDGIDLEELRPVWNVYWNELNAESL